MCGICGSLSVTSQRIAEAPVRTMLSAMIHRGPDAEGLFSEPGIVAGVRRLAVIDVTGGDQPIANENDDVRVVFNGEIYNFAELRAELIAGGHQFRTLSDTEVLVHLWEQHGSEMVHRLNGMFAFCVHDRSKRETFIARDRLGIKPLFYARDGDKLIFASEVAVLLRHDAVRGEVDSSALTELFCLQFVSGNGTVYRDIRKLPPGHAIHVHDGKVEIRRWYEIPRPAPRHDVGLADRAEELRELVESSVRFRRISDVPLGTFLSGGIDSSIITGVLSGLVDHPVQSFSVGFEGAAAFDEREYARQASTHFGTEHHELLVSPVQIAEHLPRLIEHLAEPVMDPALIPTYLLSEFARQNVTVVLTGEGADELFGGYKRYLYQRRYGWLARVPGVKQAGRGALGGMLPRRVEQALAAMGEDDPARGHLEWASVVGSRIAATLFDPSGFEHYERQVAAHFSGYFDDDRCLADQLRADQSEWLPHNLLAKVDHASMAVSLEARVPFLDHRLVDWAAGLPDEMRIRGGQTKAVLREAFRDRLPASILERSKMGFDLPLAEWIRGPLRPLAGDLLTESKLGRWEGLKAAAVRTMLDEHMRGAQDFGLPLFNLLSVMLFLDLDGQAGRR
jgi:asparagine synthase (glutamine-hydrolysing)